MFLLFSTTLCLSNLKRYKQSDKTSNDQLKHTLGSESNRWRGLYYNVAGT